MSASLLLGAAGAAFGSLPGGISIMAGLGIGQTLGALLDGTRVQRIDQGKLTDRKVSGSAYGADLPRVWGKVKVGGNCVWFAKDDDGNHLKKHKKRKKSGGKGGGGVVTTTYYYSCTLACVFAHASIYRPGTDDFSHRSPVLKRLWANDVLIYDSASSDNVVDPVWHDGTESQSPDSTIVAEDGTPTDETNAFRGLAYMVLEDFNLQDYGNQPPQFTAEIWTDAVDLADVVGDICQQRGILASELDLTAGVGVAVDGFACSSRRDGGEELEALLIAYDFDLAEIEGKLTLVSRQGSSSFAIPEEDLGAAGAAIIQQTLAGEADLPGRVDVLFYDLGAQLQQGVMSEIRQTADVTRIETLELPLALTGAQARNVAARRLDAAWLENRSFTLTVPPRWTKVAPGDRGTVTYGGTEYSVRVLGTTGAPSRQIELRCVFQSQAALDQDTAGGVDPDPDDLFVAVPTIFRVWSGVDLLDDHRGIPGFYVAAAAPAGWRGATVFYSLDAGVTWIEGPAITGETIFGETVGTLSASGAVAGTFDGTNTVEVDVTDTAGLGLDFPSTTTEDNVEAGDNQALVGSEVVGFATVTPSGTNEFTLEDLLRGQRGSTMSGHAAGELFVLLTDDVVFVPLPDSAIGATVQVKAVSQYQVLGDVTAASVTIATPRPTEIEEVKAQVLIPYMTVVDTVDSASAGSRTAVGWTTFDASGMVDAGSVFAYLQAVAWDSGDSGAGRQAIEVRKASGEEVYTIIEGKILTNDSDLSLCSTVLVPLTSSLTFDYRVVTGFQDGWELKVIGGWKPLG